MLARSEAPQYLAQGAAVVVAPMEPLAELVVLGDNGTQVAEGPHQAVMVVQGLLALMAVAMEAVEEQVRLVQEATGEQAESLAGAVVAQAWGLVTTGVRAAQEQSEFLHGR